MKIAITGGAGFVGVNLALEALQRQHEIVLLDRGDPCSRLLDCGLAEQVECLDVDLRDPGWTLPPGTDVLVHLAALAHVDYSRFKPRRVIENNVMSATHAVAQVVEAEIPMVFASSVEVYGGTEGEILHETDEYRPLSSYAASKVAGEAIAAAARHTAAARISVVRFTNLYGPWQAPDRIVPRITAQMLSDLAAEVEKGPVRDFLHVEDAVAGVLGVVEAEAWGETLNVSSGLGVDISEAAMRIKAGANPEGQIAVASQRERDGRGNHLVSSPEKLRHSVGWRPTHELGKGLEETIEWYRTHRGWWERFRDSFESDRSTPEFILDHALSGVSR